MTGATLTFKLPPARQQARLDSDSDAFMGAAS